MFVHQRKRLAGVVCPSSRDQHETQQMAIVGSVVSFGCLTVDLFMTASLQSGEPPASIQWAGELFATGDDPEQQQSRDERKGAV